MTATSKRFTADQFSGCFIVGDIEFSGNGFEDDKARAEQYAAFLNLPESEQTQSAFFALDDVKYQQEAQKRTRYGTPVHRMAYERLCELAKHTKGAKFYNPEDY